MMLVVVFQILLRPYIPWKQYQRSFLKLAAKSQKVVQKSEQSFNLN